jgi:hypothetical protein
LLLKADRAALSPQFMGSDVELKRTETHVPRSADANPGISSLVHVPVLPRFWACKRVYHIAQSAQSAA